jgi:hypothetical protein
VEPDLRSRLLKQLGEGLKFPFPYSVDISPLFM